jgi:hypothetical protein
LADICLAGNTILAQAPGQIVDFRAAGEQCYLVTGSQSALRNREPDAPG